MTDTLLIQVQPAAPEALIQFDNDALRFLVNGIEVFCLTPVGMEYKGQVVEDAGVAYREITKFFSAAKEAKNYQPTREESFDA
jgi:hypothetical protein